MVNPDKNIYEELDRILGSDIVSFYMLAYDKFVKQDFPIISSYYSTGSNDLAKVVNIPLTNFKKLFELCEEINESIIYNKYRLEQSEFWDIIVQLEDMRTFLYTVKKIDKYMRASSILNTNVGGANGTLQPEGIIPDNSIEDLLYKNTNLIDIENEWVDVALANNLSELDYGLDTSATVYFTHPFSNTSKVYLNSVIDNMDGEKMHGLDIQRYFRFDNNDLVTLSYKPTLYQSVDILSGLELGSVPEFPNFGFESPVGQNLSTAKVLLPSVIRKLKNNFDTDDTIVNFSVNESILENESLYIEVSVESAYGELITKKKKV